MSNTITNLCRPLRLQPVRKCVLMALADRADESGKAWPSLAWLCEWTCYGRRTVIDALFDLKQSGLIRIVENKGRNNEYVVDLEKVREQAGAETIQAAEMLEVPQASTGHEDANQGGSCTGAGAAPVQEPHGGGAGAARGVVQEPHGGGAGAAPDTSIDTHKTSKKRREARAEALTDQQLPGVSAQLLADYMQVRKAKKAGPFTATVLAGLQREAEKAELTLAEAITECCEAGWQGFKAEWYFRRKGVQPPASAGIGRTRELVL